MKIAVAILFFAGLFGLSSGQEGPPTNRAVPPSVGLEIGQPAPAVNPETFESLCETFERVANRIVEITKSNAGARSVICLGVDACSPRVELQTR